nr:immunoglobulin domain-containing protein [Opitutaceae bacterium]
MKSCLHRVIGWLARAVLGALASVVPAWAATDYHVATPEQFTARLGYANAAETGPLLSFATLRAGDRVLLKGGRWSGFRAVLTGEMSDAEARTSPALILACDEAYQPALGGVVVVGLARVNLRGAGLVLAGVHFSSRSGMARAGSGTDYNDNDGLAYLVAFDPGSRLGVLSHLKFDRAGWDNTDADNDRYGPWISVSGHGHTLQYSEFVGRDFDPINPPATNRSIRNATVTFNADPAAPVGGHRVRRVYFGERKVPRSGDERLYIPADGTSRSSLGNGWETLRIGNSSTQNSTLGVTVEDCVFYRAIHAHDGGTEDTVGDSEIISNKSRGNVFRRNTFLNSHGQLTLRHGDYAVVEGNFFLAGGAHDAEGRVVLSEPANRAMGGVRSIGYGNVIANNYFFGVRGTGFSSALCLVQGDSATQAGGVFVNGDDGNGYETANYNWIFGNTFIDCAALQLSNSSGGSTPVYGTRFFSNLVAWTSAGVSSSGLLTSDTSYTLAAHGGLAAGNWVYAPNSSQLGRAAQLLGTTGNTIGTGTGLDPRLTEFYAAVVRRPSDTSPVRGTGAALPPVLDSADSAGTADLAGWVARLAALDQRGVARGPGAPDPGAYALAATAAGARPLARHEVGLAAAPYPSAVLPAGAPMILAQPESRSVTVGDTVMLVVQASADADSPPRYQWRKDGLMLAGETRSRLLLASVTQAQAGTYDVVVENLHGATTSAPAVLQVAPAVAAWNSTRVRPDVDGRLLYAADAEGNRIVDFSHAGYRGGDASPPVVPVVRTLAPVPGDNTASIQAALDAVGALPVGPDGFRGALLLTAGVYPVSGTVRVRHSGVVLVGVGDELDPATNTILRRTGRSTEPVVQVGGGNDTAFRAEVPGTRSDVISPVVPLGARTLRVANPGLYAPGQAVIIWQLSTEAWLASVNYGDTVDATEAWRPGEIDLRYHRYITAIDGDTLTLDAPVYDRLDRSLAQSVVYRYDATGTVFQAGLERVFVDIETEGETAETHAWDAVRFVQAENCWARDVHTRHFVQAGIKFGGTVTRSTAERCRAVEPHSTLAGERRYNFATYRAQLVLFRHCYATQARHAYISNGASLDAGVVFLDSVDEANLLTSEGHRRWPQALLYDNIVVRRPGHPTSIGLYNRTDKGTGHGWSAVHSVVWRSDAGDPTRRIIVQKPPGAQNYAIGSLGTITGVFDNTSPAGYIEGANQPGLYPRSLYEAQRLDRLSPPVPAGAVRVFRDAFADGERATAAPPDSLAWVCSAAASNLVATPGALTLTTNGGTSGRHAVAYFPRQRLDVGGRLSYRVAFRLGAPVNDFARGVRFGLFDSVSGYATEAQRVVLAADGQNPNLAYPGYAAMFNPAPPSGASPLEIRRRVTDVAAALVTSTSAYPSALGGAGGVRQTLAAGVDYVGTLVLRRVSADAVELSFSLTGGALAGHAITRTDTTPVEAFDTAMISINSSNGTAGAGAFVLTEAELVYTPPPGFAGWRAGLFSSVELADEARSGPASDADGDGLPLLAAYAFGAVDGRVPPDRRPSSLVLAEEASRHLALSFTRRVTMPEVAIHAEGAFALNGAWTRIDESHHLPPAPLGDGTELVVVRDPVSLDEAGARFLR